MRRTPPFPAAPCAASFNASDPSTPSDRFLENIVCPPAPVPEPEPEPSAFPAAPPLGASTVFRMADRFHRRRGGALTGVPPAAPGRVPVARVLPVLVLLALLLKPVLVSDPADAARPRGLLLLLVLSLSLPLVREDEVLARDPLRCLASVAPLAAAFATAAAAIAAVFFVATPGMIA